MRADSERRRTKYCAPDAVAKAEDQQRLRKPERTVAEHLVVPKPDEGGPEAAAFGGGDHRVGQRPQNESEREKGQAEAKETVADKLRIALTLERSRREVAREKEEEAHEVGLLRGAEHV